MKAILACVAAALALLALSTPVGAQHTPPDKWKEPRCFNTEHGSENVHIALGRASASAPPRNRVRSRNGAYWFGTIEPDQSKPGPWSTTIVIHNERDYRLQLVLSDHAAAGVKARWITAKLLYVQAWWGRILATEMVVDVEAEKIIYSEQLDCGAIVNPDLYGSWKK
jgi:hypothetical protein